MERQIEDRPASGMPLDSRAGQAMDDREERARIWAKGALILTTLTLGLPIYLYNLALVERKYPLLLGKAAFLQEPLPVLDRVLFVVLFGLQVLALVLTATALLKALARRLPWPRLWSRLSGPAVALTYFLVVTVQFEVYRYFRDGIDLAQAKDLGGGSLGDALAFVKTELMGLLPVVVAGLGAGLVWAFVYRRYGVALCGALGRTRVCRWLTRPAGLVTLNAAMLLAPVAIVAFSWPLDRALERTLAYRVYRTPLAWATDFDGDGHGLLTRPFDNAPFDASRYPYAVDVPGNGVDEDGIGGALDVAAWTGPMGPWDAARLAPRNVLVVVLETARHDLLDAEVDGQPVMPRLRGIPGRQLPMISHVGFTQPAICAIFNGTLVAEEPGTSLIDRFQTLGYQTGVFSGQPEDFSDIAHYTHMDRADVRWDAARFPADERMYTGTTLASLMIPGRLVAPKFAEWVNGLDPARPFFAYFNIQEMHFPYNSPTIPKTIIERRIPRSEITAENRDWLVQTYRNAAREADTVFGLVVDALQARGLLERTLIVVVGDHGEELFDHGFLGHGIDISYEQNETLCKVIHGDVGPVSGPVGLDEVTRLIWNALVKDPQDRVPLEGRVLCLLGGAHNPRQVGLFDDTGLRKYDFTRGAWTWQGAPGAASLAIDEDLEVIHAWESYHFERNR